MTCCAPSRDGERPAGRADPAAAAAAPASAPAPGPNGREMVRLDGGRFLMGTDSAEAIPGDGETPIREIFVDPFRIDACAVSNADFAAFVDATGYRTDSERLGWSFVFEGRLSRRLRRTAIEDRLPGARWWCRIGGADWRHPEGPGSSIARRQNHPVVQVSHHDAVAYCAWAGCRLPTEAEWEFAARGGVEQTAQPWGDELEPDGEHRCNVWQGSFPDRDLGLDGHRGTCPVDAFEPNGFGLYNVCGNVWDWCADWWSPSPAAPGTRNPRGPASGTARVTRGGSYLCHVSYCSRYRLSARTHNTPDSAAGHMGFRCAAGVG